METGKKSIANKCLLLSLLLIASCGDDETVSKYTPGQASASVYLTADPGTKNVQLQTNGSWNIALDAATSKWATVKSATSGSGDATIELYYTQNSGFNRLGRMLITVAASEIPDTLYIKQYGKAAVLDLLTEYINTPATGRSDTLAIYTNLPQTQRNQASAEAIYEGSDTDWITDLKLSANLSTLSFKTTANTSTAARKADILLVLTDDWGVRRLSTCRVEQAKMGGTAQTREETFENVRKLITAAAGTLIISTDIKISGIIISDCGNPNVAENPNVTPTSVDFTANDRTAYIQNATGACGFKLVTTTKEVNSFHRYDHLTLWLKGLTLVKESNPERYSITGITHDYLISATAGAKSDLAGKERYIGELTDADLYTFVKLKDCELPIRKGSFTPINEGYGIVYTGSVRVDKYPLLVRDRKGDVTYLWTNLGCPYRRDGSTLPQGSGSISGIVVNEKYTRFEKGGDIGKFQLRHLVREDIGLAQAAAGSFSTVICEWNRYVANGTKASPTSGAGELYHSTGAALSAASDFSYPGPITGVEAEDKKGVVSGAAISKTGWWNSGKGESWIVRFSTQGISGTQLSLQLATLDTKIGAPRYWVAETSLTGDANGTWDAVAEYTVPDIVNWDNTLLEQLSGWKNINIPLPATLFNKANVYVRLRVKENKAGTSTAYDSATIDATAGNTIAYLSVRYN
ncbi:MAG: hypothetical protein LBC40_08890 [Dysgonamonadaceae bacterium]|jgi:hypothetical protein|nr:hypothetical protein [Dysgonamonadaceae bacterium]